MRTRLLPLIGGALIGLATLTATNGLLAAQESTPVATASNAEMAAKMDQMMDQCIAMMEMMSMMGSEGMPGMEEMAPAATTPGA